eukprot:364520-Amphidinium_carterae.1
MAMNTGRKVPKAGVNALMMLMILGGMALHVSDGRVMFESFPDIIDIINMDCCLKHLIETKVTKHQHH